MTEPTSIERNLQDLVRSLGFAVVEEREFPPYRVDLYVPELHVAFEADGPLHWRKRDQQRDHELGEQYGLVVHRIKQVGLLHHERIAQSRDEILTNVHRWAETASERKAMGRAL